MTAFLWFALGFFVAEFIGLITTTTPRRAAKNLRGWWAILTGRRSP